MAMASSRTTATSSPPDPNGRTLGDVAFERISIDPKVMAGVPCIKGTRIPVATVVGMVAEGMPVEEILTEYPQLSEDDVREALRYASARVDEREVELHLGA